MSKETEAVLNALSEIKKEIHNRAEYPDAREIHAYITLWDLDGIIQKFINKYKEKDNVKDRKS